MAKKNKNKPTKAPRKGPIKFIKDVRSELKKVTWLNKKELKTYTIVVVVTIVASSILIGLIDYGLSSFMNWFLSL
ncbi:MAG: preprotein translocase subunit SecE [Clostridia bacterium]|nr:preprotein translocase subunit SecE [Clostridia bacterium]